jgi:hypothetical protein
MFSIARKPFRIPQSRFCGSIGLFCGLTAATLSKLILHIFMTILCDDDDDDDDDDIDR